MFRRFAFPALLVLLATFAAAQEATGRIVEVRVDGTATYADIVRTIITTRVGTGSEGLDLEAERNRVYSLGTFESVSVELESSPSGTVLVVRVTENPLIGEVEFEGVTSLDTTALLAALASTHLLEPGRVYNTIRAADALGTIRQAYRQVGFPFDVNVDLEVMQAPDLAESAAAVPVRLIYTVDEAAELEEIVFEGNTVLDDAALETMFRGLTESEVFDQARYREVVQAVATRYALLGYRNSGVDTEATTLSNGVLRVAFRELTIASIDTTALGVDPSDLTLQPGDLFNYDVLLDDVRRLARGRSSDIQLDAGVTASGAVRVTFRLGAPETAGPVDRIVFEGNTVMTDEELESAMKLQVGDTFTSAVANEDFGRIVRAYQDEGYRVLTQPDFSYDDGTYIQRVTELRIGEYQVVYDGEPGSTRDFVVTRYLPDVGTVLNDEAVVDGLLDVARLGVLDVVNYGLEPTGTDGEVRVVVTVRKRLTGELRPAAQYATDSGFSASLGYNERNFLGRAHTVGAELDVLSTDVGVMVGGRIGYEIPWLYIDALDFREVPTSFSVSLFSVVSNNQPLSANGQTTMTFPGLAPVEENRVRVGEYTTRSTGAGFTVGRPIAPFTSLVVGANGAYNEHKFEPTKVDCIIEDGVITNTAACYLPSELAVTFLPTGGLSAFASTRVTYDDRDSSDFPTEGVAAYGGIGVGFGNDFLDPVTRERTTYVYEQVIAGGRTYLRMSDVMPDEIEDDNHIFAVRLDVGHQFGGSYPESKRFFVGRSNDVATQIRGFTREDFNLSKSYVTSSFEYRYDFQLSTFATQTVIGIAFVDLGWASHVPGFEQYQTPLFAGAGVGVQLNLGFGGVVLPAVRLDYAFSERHPAGVFSFRVGPVF